MSKAFHHNLPIPKLNSNILLFLFNKHEQLLKNNMPAPLAGILLTVYSKEENDVMIIRTYCYPIRRIQDTLRLR